MRNKEIIDDFGYGIFKTGVRDRAVAVYTSRQLRKALEHAAELGAEYQCSSCSMSINVVN